MLKFAKVKPDLRFPNFQGEWEEVRIGRYINEFRSQSNENNEYQVLTSSNRGLMKQEEYYGENRITRRDNTGFNIIPPGYITYRSRSDDRTFTFNVNDLGITGVVSTYYPVFSMRNGSNKFFVEYFNYHQHYLGRHSVGTSQQVLSLNELREIRLRVPEDAEQQKIAAFLSAMDEKIGKLSKKAELLLKYKKVVMRQIFDQEIRFKDERGKDFPNWEVTRLGDKTIWASGGTPAKDVSRYWNGDIPWISASSMRGSSYSDSDLRITPEGLKKGSRLAPKGSLLVLVRGSMLHKSIPVGIAVRDLAFNQDVKSIQCMNGLSAHFLLHLLIHSQHRLLSMVASTGIGAGKIDLGDLKNMFINIPTPNEQNKITNFLSVLDQRIDLVAQQLEMTRQFKKGLLEQMFV